MNIAIWLPAVVGYALISAAVYCWLRASGRVWRATEWWDMNFLLAGLSQMLSAATWFSIGLGLALAGAGFIK